MSLLQKRVPIVWIYLNGDRNRGDKNLHLQLLHVQVPLDPSPLIISIATTCAATVATFFLGLFAARAMFHLRGSLRAWVDGVLTLPLVLPPTVVGFFLLLIFGRRSPVGHALEHIGIMVVFSWPATVIAATVVAFPLMYRTSLGALEQVNPTLLQAARTLGASEWVVFRRVQLQLAGPGILAGTVLAFARAMGEFGATLMLAGNIPGRTQTMPIAIFSAAESGDMRGAAMWVVLIVGISLAIIRLLNYERKTRPALPEPESSVLISRTSGVAPEAIVTSRAVNKDRGDRIGLEIDVERKLENFVLRVAFRSGQGAAGLLGPSGAGTAVSKAIPNASSSPDPPRYVE